MLCEKLTDGTMGTNVVTRFRRLIKRVVQQQDRISDRLRDPFKFSLYAFIAVIAIDKKHWP